MSMSSRNDFTRSIRPLSINSSVEECGEKLFTRTSLHKLLTNVAHIGKISYKNEIHNGEYAAIVDLAACPGVTPAERSHRRGRGAEPIRSAPEGVHPLRPLRGGYAELAKTRGSRVFWKWSEAGGLPQFSSDGPKPVAGDIESNMSAALCNATLHCLRGFDD